MIRKGRTQTNRLPLSILVGTAIGLKAVLLPAAAVAAPLDWQLLDIRPEMARWSMAVAYDSHRERLVLFGGREMDNVLRLGDTWEFDGTSWTQVPTAHAPSPRFWHGMVYDSARQRVVLFGGGDRDVPDLRNDTWEYDGTDWYQVATAHAPSPRDEVSMAYDSLRNRTVLFGGVDLGAELNETWEYDGTDWTQVATTHSPSRGSLAAMAFDSARGRVVFFGAGALSDGELSDIGTWEYDGTDWTRVYPPSAPMDRWAHTMAYDASRGTVVLFGGYGPSWPSGTQLDDLWEYDGIDWAPLYPATVPAAREQHGMAYDSAVGRILMFGGIGPGAYGDDTWGFPAIGDSDGDGVYDGSDECPDTAAGATVDPETGCSIDQLCPCESTWKNHGLYVSCVAHVSRAFVDAGLLSRGERHWLISEAARSACGQDHDGADSDSDSYSDSDSDSGG